MDKKIIGTISNKIVVSFIIIKLLLDLLLQLLIYIIYPYIYILFSFTDQNECSSIVCWPSMEQWLMYIIITVITVSIMSTLTPLISVRIASKYALTEENIDNETINSIKSKSFIKLILSYLSIFVIVTITIFWILKNTLICPEWLNLFYWYENISIIGSVICFFSFKLQKNTIIKGRR